MTLYADHQKGCEVCRHPRMYHKRLGKQSMGEAGGPCQKIGCKCRGFVPMAEPRKNPPPGRGRILVGTDLTKIVSDSEAFEARGKSMGKIWGLADGSLLLSGLFARAPRGAVREIWYVDVAKSKAEGLKSPGRPWRHVFRERIALMRSQGGLLMKAKGRRLWEVR